MHISWAKSAFVEGKFILDNVLIALEIIHHMRWKTKKKTWKVTLKIDISKSFDKVDWKYLFLLMGKMGLSWEVDGMGKALPRNY